MDAPQGGRSCRSPSRLLLASRFRALLSRPSRVVTLFWATTALAVFSMLPLQHWGRSDLRAMLVVAGVLVVGLVTRLLIGTRLPGWCLHVDVAVGTVLVSVLAGVGADQRIPLATLYVWVAIFAALYFRPVAVLIHVGAAGLLYAGILAYSPKVHNPAASWLAIFGTATVAGAVVCGLVSLLRQDARQDSLTGLANRRCWDERLGEEMERARRAGTVLSVAIVDLDDFKAVNDLYGHQMGDRLLCDLAMAWQGAIRGGGDFLARLGGDEFGLLVCGSEASAIDHLVDRLAEMTPNGVTYSIGIATWDGDESGGELLRRADQEMYVAKLARRGIQDPTPWATQTDSDTIDCDKRN